MKGYNKKSSSRGRRNFGQGIMGDDPLMKYKATCDNCGKTCEVPFRPTSGKPVYCNDCFRFKRDSDDGNSRQERRSFSSNSSQYEDKEMFSAICDECGKRCDLPFKPSNNKPLYCSDCFEKKGNRRSDSHLSNKVERKLEEINTKLDELLDMLKKHNI